MYNKKISWKLSSPLDKKEITFQISRSVDRSSAIFSKFSLKIKKRIICSSEAISDVSYDFLPDEMTPELDNVTQIQIGHERIKAAYANFPNRRPSVDVK